MPALKNLFWDSCVFIRYLTRQPTDYLADIDQYISEAKEGKYVIHCSSLVLVEVRPRFLKKKGFGTAEEFMSDLGSAFVLTDPNPIIMSYAGVLRDHEPVNLGNPKSGEPAKRSIGTPDSIHLATCIHLRDVLGVSDIVFHTFDEGKGKNWEGKCVPIIGFERWFPPDHRPREIVDVCSLTRTKPEHPSPDLATRASTNATVIAQPSP